MQRTKRCAVALGRTLTASLLHADNCVNVALNGICFKRHDFIGDSTWVQTHDEFMRSRKSWATTQQFGSMPWPNMLYGSCQSAWRGASLERLL